MTNSNLDTQKIQNVLDRINYNPNDKRTREELKKIKNSPQLKAKTEQIAWEMNLKKATMHELSILGFDIVAQDRINYDTANMSYINEKLGWNPISNIEILVDKSSNEIIEDEHWNYKKSTFVSWAIYNNDWYKLREEDKDVYIRENSNVSWTMDIFVDSGSPLVPDIVVKEVPLNRWQDVVDFVTSRVDSNFVYDNELVFSEKKSEIDNLKRWNNWRNIVNYVENEEEKWEKKSKEKIITPNITVKVEFPKQRESLSNFLKNPPTSIGNFRKLELANIRALCIYIENNSLLSLSKSWIKQEDANIFLANVAEMIGLYNNFSEKNDEENLDLTREINAIRESAGNKLAESFRQDLKPLREKNELKKLPFSSLVNKLKEFKKSTNKNENDITIIYWAIKDKLKEDWLYFDNNWKLLGLKSIPQDAKSLEKLSIEERQTISILLSWNDKEFISGDIYKESIPSKILLSCVDKFDFKKDDSQKWDTTDFIINDKDTEVERNFKKENSTKFWWQIDDKIKELKSWNKKETKSLSKEEKIEWIQKLEITKAFINDQINKDSFNEAKKIIADPSWRVALSWASAKDYKDAESIITKFQNWDIWAVVINQIPLAVWILIANWLINSMTSEWPLRTIFQSLLWVAWVSLLTRDLTKAWILPDLWKIVNSWDATSISSSKKTKTEKLLSEWVEKASKLTTLVPSWVKRYPWMSETYTNLYEKRGDLLDEDNKFEKVFWIAISDPKFLWTNIEEIDKKDIFKNFSSSTKDLILSKWLTSAMEVFIEKLTSWKIEWIKEQNDKTIWDLFLKWTSEKNNEEVHKYMSWEDDFNREISKLVLKLEWTPDWFEFGDNNSPRAKVEKELDKTTSLFDNWLSLASDTSTKYMGISSFYKNTDSKWIDSVIDRLIKLDDWKNPVLTKIIEKYKDLEKKIKKRIELDNFLKKSGTDFSKYFEWASKTANYLTKTVSLNEIGNSSEQDFVSKYLPVFDKWKNINDINKAIEDWQKLREELKLDLDATKKIDEALFRLGQMQMDYMAQNNKNDPKYLEKKKETLKYMLANSPENYLDRIEDIWKEITVLNNGVNEEIIWDSFAKMVMVEDHLWELIEISKIDEKELTLSPEQLNEKATEIIDIENNWNSSITEASKKALIKRKVEELGQKNLKTIEAVKKAKEYLTWEQWSYESFRKAIIDKKNKSKETIEDLEIKISNVDNLEDLNKLFVEYGKISTQFTYWWALKWSLTTLSKYSRHDFTFDDWQSIDVKFQEYVKKFETDNSYTSTSPSFDISLSIDLKNKENNIKDSIVKKSNEFLKKEFEAIKFDDPSTIKNNVRKFAEMKFKAYVYSRLAWKESDFENLFKTKEAELITYLKWRITKDKTTDDIKKELSIFDEFKEFPFFETDNYKKLEEHVNGVLAERIKWLKIWDAEVPKEVKEKIQEITTKYSLRTTDKTKIIDIINNLLSKDKNKKQDLEILETLIKWNNADAMFKELKFTIWNWLDSVWEAIKAGWSDIKNELKQAWKDFPLWESLVWLLVWGVAYKKIMN